MKIELISYSQPDVYFVENMTELVANSLLGEESTLVSIRNGEYVFRN